MNRYKPKGWRRESYRHSLASKGIKTKLDLVPTKFPSGRPVPKDIQQKIRQELDKDDPNWYVRKHFPNKDFDKDGLPNKYDCDPLDPKQQGRVHDFFDSLLHHKKREHPEKTKEIEQAQKDVKKVKTSKDLEGWFKKHRLVLAEVGVVSAVIVPIGATLEFSVLMQSILAGELLSVGSSVYMQKFIKRVTGQESKEKITEEDLPRLKEVEAFQEKLLGV